MLNSPALRYSPSEFRPLRIRAYLRAGVISDQSLPLDAVLYYHYVRDVMGEEWATVPGAVTLPTGLDIRLPLLILSGPRPDQWFYGCSFARWPDHTVEDRTFYTKRLRLQYASMIDFQGRRGRVQTERGRYKGYHLNAYYRHALHVDWYAVGDAAAISAALRFCTHLGKKTAHGWGAVLSWEVMEWPEDWSLKDSDGRLMRAVPARSGEGFLCGIRPSYWLREHQFPCVMPKF